jgi:hypothetical protein
MRLVTIVGMALAAAAVVWVVFIGVPRWVARRAASAQTPANVSAPVAELPTRKIKARLYFVAEDGLRLVATDQDVEYGEGLVEQAKRIVEAQLRPAPEPLASPIPAGTKLQALYLTDAGDAYVDLSPEVSSAHPGGSLNETFTVYAIVNALTTNLPRVTAVQILVGGHEADTLAGHVDLRRPLQPSTAWSELPPPPGTDRNP